MNLAIFGGTFDPPHYGHLRIAETAQQALGLEQIVFIPAKQPPHKLDDPVSPLEHRVAMLELTLAPHPAFVISMIEAMRQGPSYSVDTLHELRRELGYDDEIYFIMGMDSLVNFPTWHEPEIIVKLCKLAVLERPGIEPGLDALEQKVPGLKASLVMIPTKEIDISSSDIRNRVREHKSIQNLVPPLVADYIREYGLYLDAVGKSDVEQM